MPLKHWVFSECLQKIDSGFSNTTGCGMDLPLFYLTLHNYLCRVIEILLKVELNIITHHPYTWLNYGTAKC